MAEKSRFLTAFGMTAAHKYGKELHGTTHSLRPDIPCVEHREGRPQGQPVL
jgi:hypothetical protein